MKLVAEFMESKDGKSLSIRIAEMKCGPGPTT